VIVAVSASDPAGFQRARLVRHAAGTLSLLLIAAAFALLQLHTTGRFLLPVLTAFAVVAIAALLGLGSAGRSLPRVDPFCIAAVLSFSAYVVARALTSPVPYVARVDLYSVLAALVVYGIVATTFWTTSRRSTLVILLLLLALVHVLVSLVQSGVGENLSLVLPWLAEIRSNPRGSGLFLNPNNLAGFLTVVALLGLSLSCWGRWRPFPRVLVAYLTATAFLGIALTGSRGGYLSIAAGVVVFGLLSLLVLRAAGAATLLRAGTIGLLLLAGGLYGLWHLIDQNPALSRRIDEIAADTHRTGLWQAAVEQWKLQPLVGTGSGTFLFYGRQFRPEKLQSDPIHAHNDYLELLAEYGIIGAAAFLLFLLVHVYSGWRGLVHFGMQRVAADAPLPSTRMALIIGALSAIAAYSVHSAVDFNLHLPANALLVAAVFGILASPGFPAAAGQRPIGTLVPQFATGAAAILLLVQCARLLPGEHFADQARKALWAENPGAAIHIAEKALQHEQRNPQIYFYLGRALLASMPDDATPEQQRASYENALAAFEQARRVAPLDRTYALELASTLGRAGRFEEAEEMYQVARALDPKSRAVAQLYERHRRAWRLSKRAQSEPATAPPNERVR
jgi:O-antigen ligase